MVKEIAETLLLQSCSARKFFELIYEDLDFLRRFHAEVNNDDNAIVPDWEGTSRTLTFHTPVNAPAVLSRLIGTEKIQVIETQSYFQGADGSITLESNPVPQIPGAANFSSTAVITLRDAQGGSACMVTGHVTCSATGPYGFVGTIEGFMADSARRSLINFLSYCREYVESIVQEESPSIAPGEAFFDVEEESMALPDLSEPGAVSLEALALYLQYLTRSGDHAAALLHDIDARLARIESVMVQDGAEFLMKPAHVRQAGPKTNAFSAFSRLCLTDTCTYRGFIVITGLVVSTAAVTATLYFRFGPGRRARGGP